MTFLAVLVGSALGTFAGNSILLWIIGNKAQKLEEARRKEIEEFQKGIAEAVEAERSRMAKYAKMEG